MNKIVNSWNEWDPLEEVIVGITDGAMIEPWEPIVAATAHVPEDIEFYRKNGGTPWPKELLDAAKADLERLVHILEAEGVTVRRPTPHDTSKPFRTPDFESKTGYGFMMPRDGLMVVGDLLIESAMGMRSRYFMYECYKDLCKEYHSKGARWIAAPRPQLGVKTYKRDFVPPKEGEPMRTILTEFEIICDAADFIRCGRDIFAIQSSTCNRAGINWVQSVLGDEFRVHEIEHFDPAPMHIDGTFYPLAPGKLLINPVRVKKVPEMFKKAGWDILVAPEPLSHRGGYTASKWIGMNVLMLDEKRVIVDAGSDAMIKAFKGWGFKPILCEFGANQKIQGGFHCATVDIRRRGELKSYF